jgi:LacI family transcriptional regulator
LTPARNHHWKIIRRQAIDAVLQLTNFCGYHHQTANKIGLNVPKDLAVIAFTDGIISKYSTPTI